MIDINDFEVVFTFKPDYSYPHQLFSDIQSHRRSSGVLFFDRLLATLNVKAPNLYPPHTNKDLRELHAAIVSSPIADHHKQSLLFYIIKDCRSHEETNTADDFARACGLPDKYWTCVDGLWHMDRHQWRPAVELLTHPSIVPPAFPEEVLFTLLRLCKEEDHTLPLAYYNTIQPPLSRPELLDEFFKYLARISITEAFYFIRTQPEHDQQHLLRLLIHESLSGATGNERSDRGMELVDLPFTEEEEATFEEYLLVGDGKGHHGARDAVMMRKIATGRFREALDIGKQLKGRRIDDVSWDSIKNAIKDSLGPRADVYAVSQ